MLRWVVRIVGLAVLVVMAGAVVEVIVRASDQTAKSTDAIVVLGAAQFDGTPQPVFENRLRHAADMWFLRGGTLVTVGGKLPGDRFTEADSGKRYLVDQGVSAESVIAVPTGSDTWESLIAVAKVLHEQDISSVTVVSDPAHVARSRIKLLHLGIPTVEVSPTTTGAGSVLTPRYLVRETLGIMRFWVTTDWFRDRGGA
jgi:uncharacterized SAM-binding protein YcdF (DUF218 family)